MRKLGIALVPILLLALVIGADSCGSTTGSPINQAIDSFFGDDHATNTLDEYNQIIIDASYVFSTSGLSRDACSLLKRVNENREEIANTDCPEELFPFWFSIHMSAVRLTWALQEFCAQGLTQTSIDQWRLCLENREKAHSILEELLSDYE